MCFFYSQTVFILKQSSFSNSFQSQTGMTRVSPDPSLHAGAVRSTPVGGPESRLNDNPDRICSRDRDGEWAGWLCEGVSLRVEQVIVPMTYAEKERSPGDLLAGIESHLQMIEARYPLTITNKDQVAGRTLGKTHDQRCILSITLSLNHWAAVNGITGDVVIPEKVLDLIL